MGRALIKEGLWYISAQAPISLFFKTLQSHKINVYLDNYYSFAGSI